MLEVILHPRIHAKVSLVYVKPWRFLSGRPGCQALACRSLLALTFKSVTSGYTKRCSSAPDIESLEKGSWIQAVACAQLAVVHTCCTCWYVHS